MTDSISPAPAPHVQPRQFVSASGKWEKPIEVKVEHVEQRFRETLALKDLTREICSGELLVLFVP